jgi:hypothetical protein
MAASRDIESGQTHQQLHPAKKNYANVNGDIINKEPARCIVEDEVASFCLTRKVRVRRPDFTHLTSDHLKGYESSFRIKSDTFMDLYTILEMTNEINSSDLRWINHSCNLLIPQRLKTLGFSQELFELMRYENDLVWEHANTEWLKYRRMIHEGNPGVGYDQRLIDLSSGAYFSMLSDNVEGGAVWSCMVCLMIVPLTLLALGLMCALGAFGVVLNIVLCQCCSADEEYMKYIEKQERLHPELTYDARRTSIKRKYKEAIARIKSHLNFASCKDMNVNIVYREGIVLVQERVSRLIYDDGEDYAYNGMTIKIGSDLKDPEEDQIFILPEDQIVKAQVINHGEAFTMSTQPTGGVPVIICEVISVT